MLKYSREEFLPWNINRYLALHTEVISRGAYAVKELVYVYSMWISPKFYMHVVQTYDALVKATTLLRDGTTKFPQDALLWKSLCMLAYERGDEATARKALTGSTQAFTR